MKTGQFTQQFRQALTFVGLIPPNTSLPLSKSAPLLGLPKKAYQMHKFASLVAGNPTHFNYAFRQCYGYLKLTLAVSLMGWGHSISICLLFFCHHQLVIAAVASYRRSVGQGAAREKKIAARGSERTRSFAFSHRVFRLYFFALSPN